MKGLGIGRGFGVGVSGDDVTWMITSSGPLICEYFLYIYIKVYGGSNKSLKSANVSEEIYDNVIR